MTRRRAILRRASHAARYLQTCSQAAAPISWPACPSCSTCMWASTLKAPYLHAVTLSNTNNRIYPMTKQQPNTVSDVSQRSRVKYTGRLACVLLAWFRFMKSDLSLMLQFIQYVVQYQEAKHNYSQAWEPLYVKTSISLNYETRGRFHRTARAACLTSPTCHLTVREVLRLAVSG